MTRDEETMEMHAKSGKFGKTGSLIEDTPDFCSLNNRLILISDLRHVADLLEEILKAKPPKEWLEQLFIPEMADKGIIRLAKACVELIYLKDKLSYRACLGRGSI